jgi:hypothetical protein
MLVERLVLARFYYPDSSQLFILGLPRSGTTLVYQYIVHRLPVAYFTNGVGTAPYAPCVVTYAQRRRYGDYCSDFQSSYGKVQGPVAPREAGGFWNRFFDSEAYTTFAEMRPKQIRTLRNTIGCIQMLFGDAPFVNKNVKHMLRIDALARLFPRSRFLVVERPLPDVALSVLRGRYANNNSAHEWWSVRPPNYAALKDLAPEEQVAQQLIALEAQMETDIAQLVPQRVLRIQYDAFCHNPELLTTLVQQALGPLAARNPAEATFQQSHNQARTPEEVRLLELLATTRSAYEQEL